MVTTRFIVRSFLGFSLIGFLSLLIIGYKILFQNNLDSSYTDFYVVDNEVDHRQLDDELKLEEEPNETVTEPIILWWTPFTFDMGKYKTCGDVKCFFTINRKYQTHPMMKVFMFYGSDLKAWDLPLPRKPHHEWSLLHEESPKNNILFSFPEVMNLFNHTSTFRRESSYPITTQYLNSLEWLKTDKYLVTTSLKNKYQKELSPLIYTHSDCDPPSDRDHYTKLLMMHITVDSYGSCLHNKDLPKHLQKPLDAMNHPDFYQLIGKYKFALAMENGRCNDYITEKIWRPLMAGAVPVILGAQTIKDFLPSNHSAIHIDDFQTVEDLAKYLHYLNRNDAEYEKYLMWKKTGVTNKYLKALLRDREWSVDSPDNLYHTSPNFIEGFECFVCRRIHDNIKQNGALKYQATVDHYGCPKPVKFDDSGRPDPNKSVEYDFEWNYYQKVATALRYFIDKNVVFTRKQLSEKIGISPMY